MRDRKCAYRSVFGPIEINRAYCQAKGAAGVFPLEAEINLPERGYSYFLQEIASKLAVNGSYEKACEDASRYYEEKPAPELDSEAMITVATLDKKGVVIRKPPSEATDVETACVDPNKPGKKKMSTEVCAYTIKRHIRTADDVVGELARERASSLKPKPQTKLVWGSLSEGPEKAVARLAEAITERLCWASEFRGAWFTSIFPRHSSCSIYFMFWNTYQKRLIAFIKRRALKPRDLYGGD